MAERRMFAKSIVLSDAFLDMPLGARCLYMTMGMLADDDGFVNNPKSIIRQCGASEDDLRILFAKKFVIPFESGVVVIKHWRINNYLRNDRYHPTNYIEEMNQLLVDGNEAYSKKDGIPSIGIPSIGKDSIGKDSIGKDSIGKDNISTKDEKHKHGEYGHVLLTNKEYQKLQEDFGNADELISYLDEAIEMKGYKYKSHYLAIRKWVVDAVKKDHQQTPSKSRLPDFKSPYKSVIEEQKPITIEEQEIKGRYVVDEDYVLPEPPTIMDFGIYCRDHNLLGVNPPKIHATYVSNGQWKEGIKYFDMETACKRAYRGINGIPEEFYQLPKKWEDEE